MLTDDPKAAIRDRALELGFDVVGFAAPRLAEGARADLADYLARGYHGDMGWLAKNAERRGDPTVLWPEAKSALRLGLDYGTAEDPRRLQEARTRGAISVYARGRDYHNVLKKRLKALARWVHESLNAEVKVFVDTESDLRLIRRIRRDLSERGRSLESVLDQYLRTVRPMQLEFAEPSMRWADVIVPEGGENRVAVDMVIARVRELLSDG